MTTGREILFALLLKNSSNRRKKFQNVNIKLALKKNKKSGVLDQRNVIDTDLVGKTDKEKSNELKKQQATILKILLWIEPDPEKGVANSLHEVMFDFANNLTTWVNHREMGKLIPEC